MTTSSPLACPRCSGSMEAGFLLDRSHGTLHAAQWVGGTFEPSFWTGLKNLKDRETYRLTSYRCERCGYLELYALPQPAGDEDPA